MHAVQIEQFSLLLQQLTLEQVLDECWRFEQLLLQLRATLVARKRVLGCGLLFFS